MLQRDWFNEEAFEGATRALTLFSNTNPDWASLITLVPKLRQVDFLSSQILRHDYALQTHINPRRVWMLAACAVHYDLYFGLVVRYLDGEYLARWRDIEAIIGAAEGLVSNTDLRHMR